MKTNPLIKIVSIASLLLSGFAQAGLNDFEALPLAPATDWKGYAGANCMPANEPGNYLRTSFGYINEGSGSAMVICPVVRDVYRGGKNRVKRARITITSRGNGYCRFHSRSRQGDAFDVQVINFGIGNKIDLNFDNADADDWGSYLISCLIPGVSDKGKKSYIHSYAVDEVS